MLLITSRETKRWVIPKGWPIDGKDGPGTAATEAMEEAGLIGDVGAEACGAYDYVKRAKDGTGALVRVEVFPFAVRGQASDWREKGQRRHQWSIWTEAALMVHEPELSALINTFGRERSRPPTLLERVLAKYR